MTHRSRLAAAAALLFTIGPAFGIQSTRGTKTPGHGGTAVDELRITARLDEIRAQRNAFEANRLVERAVSEQLRGRDEAAEPLFAKAVELDPQNERAREGLAGARERLGLVTEPRPLIVRAEREMRIKQQEVRYRFDAALELAADAVRTGRAEGFRKARVEIDRARVAQQSNPNLFSVAESGRMEAKLRRAEMELAAAIRQRDDAERAAVERDRARRIKQARVHDRSLGL